ncbi:MAG: aldo/keto reductase [Verrucomicrobia bacterium]|nr:aldo/keto reductase [Verrucomicrobiota bacterium]
MRKKVFPNTNLMPSELCLGTAEFGSKLAVDEAKKLIEHYLASGGNVLDTAEIYAEWLPDGSHRSEKFLGEYLRRRGKHDDLVISTKGGHPRLSSMHVSRMSRADVQSDLDSSLRRLGIETVDIYWLHRDAPEIPVEEILSFLEDFRKTGKIRYYGFSNWTLPRAEAARQAAERLNVKGFVASQNQWSLAKADPAKGDPTWAYIDKPFIDWHIQYNLSSFPYTPQANGYFRHLERGSLDRASDVARKVFHHPENVERLERIKVVQAQTGYTQSQIVLSFLLSQPFTVFPIIGARKINDLEESISATEAPLTSEQLAILSLRSGV